ncbi:hypothetical protein GBAR_LOCUS8685 [Geodia barretti]|nr:hypothetical protein GBAR_LOCUS8685 [Geodia barretti]
MLEKLGPKASWKALWEKLEHYLSQLRMLADTLLGSHKYNVGRKRPCRTRAPQLQKFTAPPEPESPSGAASNPPSQASSSTVPTQPVATPISSPRKRKKPVEIHPPAPSEMQVTPPDPSLAPRQLLDILLEDESLQQHLAGLINSSLLGDGGPELMDHALDEILAMATPDEHHTTTSDENQC